LYDPDGDAVLRCLGKAGAGSSSRLGQKARLACVRKTPLGVWGLCLASECQDEGSLELLAAAETRLLIVPAVWGERPDSTTGEWWTGVAKRLKAFICRAVGFVAGAGSTGPAGSTEAGSFVCGPDGRMIACGPAPQEQVVFAELAGVRGAAPDS
jgi:predicted amidohydrolase